MLGRLYGRLLACALTLALALSLTAVPAQAQGYYTEVDAATDAHGLPPIFHYITWRESRDNPYAVNPYSGACGPYQFLPSTAAYYGFSCYELTDPWTAAYAAKLLYLDYGLSPWALTAY